MKVISALDFRKKVGGILDEVADKKTPIAISRGKRNLAVLVPYEEYLEHFDHVLRRTRIQTAISRIAETRAKYSAELKYLDPVKLVRQMRDER